MSKSVGDIPQLLVYEVLDGQPIYYAGYQAYLDGNKTLEEIIGSSYLQSLIVTQLIIYLSQQLDTTAYQLLTNEVGLLPNNHSRRAADIAIYRKHQLTDIPIANHYLSIPPEIVMGIDTKAHLEDIQNPLGYYQEKTDQLLAFGVERVIWIFTDTQKVMVAQQHEDLYISNWSKSILVIDDVMLNLDQLISAV